MMAKKPELDQAAISEALGSTMVPGGGARFGRMGVQPLAASASKDVRMDDVSGIRVIALLGGFVIVEPQPEGRALYYGPWSTASRTDMLLPDEVFPTREEAETRMLEMWPAPEGCMGPAAPGRDAVVEATAAVVEALRGQGLLMLAEDSLVQPMAECRRRALWWLEKAVEEILWQDARELLGERL